MQVPQGSVMILAGAVAARAGLLHGEEALLHAHLAVAAAGGQVSGLVPGLAPLPLQACTAPGSARGSSPWCRAPHLRAQIQVVAQVGAAIDRAPHRARPPPKMSPNTSPKMSRSWRRRRRSPAAGPPPAEGSTPAWPNWS
jgi:hypothetical protein